MPTSGKRRRGRARFRVQVGAPILHPGQPRVQRFMRGVNVRAFGRVHWIGWR